MGKATNPFLLNWMAVIFFIEPNNCSWRSELKRDRMNKEAGKRESTGLDTHMLKMEALKM